MKPTRFSDRCESDTALILARFLALADAAAFRGDRDGAIEAVDAIMAYMDAITAPRGGGSKVRPADGASLALGE